MARGLRRQGTQIEVNEIGRQSVKRVAFERDAYG